MGLDASMTPAVNEVCVLDAAHKYSFTWYVVFRSARNRRSRWWRLLRDGFHHVELWRRIGDGVWLRLDTSIEFISAEVYGQPPWELVPASDTPTIVCYSGRVPHGQFRQPFRVGPVTCVELAAAVLGIRLPFWVRTPYQLYRRICGQETES